MASNYWGKNAGKGPAAKVEKAVRRQAKREVRRTSPLTWIIPLLCLVLSFVLVTAVCRAIGKDDGFSLKGEASYTIAVGTAYTYEEEGYLAMALGQDVSATVKVESNMTQNVQGAYCPATTEEGVYYIR